MAARRTQFSDNPLIVWVDWDDATTKVTGIEVANPNPVAVLVEVQKNNGQWTAFNVPANQPLTTFPVQQSQYTITIVNGEVDVAPNIRYS